MGVIEMKEHRFGFPYIRFVLVRFSLCCFLGMSLPAIAAWDLSSLRSTGVHCQTRETFVDESKLNVRFSEFYLTLSPQAGASGRATIQCALSVNYHLPAGRRFSSLTHRILMQGSKQNDSILKLTAVVEIDGVLYTQAGILDADSRYSGRLLLYKSYDVAHSAECLRSERIVQVTAVWTAELEQRGQSGISIANLSDDEDGVDLWLEEESCVY